MSHSVASRSIDISNAIAIGGWMSERELNWLATQALNRELIVEFGCLHGRSTRALADNCNGVIWAVDPWAGEYYSEDGTDSNVINTYVYPYFAHNLRDHIKIGRVIPVRGYSYNFNSDGKLSKRVDMVFIDGDHRKETVPKDIAKALDLLKPGGLICGHDYGHPMWPGVKEVVDDMFGNSIQIEDSIWWTHKS